jgi:threonine dehydrogenase-like Zn-dependent dehydrogenase
VKSKKMGSYKGLQLWHNGKGQSSFRDITLTSHKLGSDELILKSLYSFISAGTERTIISHPPDDESVAEEMNVPYMNGSFKSAFTYGYSLVGEVMAGPKKWLGKIVHVMHPHQDYALVNERDVSCIPEEISPRMATLISNLETVVNAVWDSGVSLGDKVLIVGFGNIGALLASVIRKMPGVDVDILETNLYRRDIASKQNFNVVKGTDLKWKYTISFNTSGSGSGLQEALNNTTIEGKVVELSWYGPKIISLELGGSFHYGRKHLISSQVSRIPANKSHHFNYQSRKEIVIRILKEIDFDFMTNIEIPFRKATGFYDKLVKGEVNEIGLLFNYK